MTLRKTKAPSQVRRRLISKSELYD